MLAEKIYTLIYEYLNALIDANWARLIVNTNFHFGRRGSPLSFSSEEGGVYSTRVLDCIAPRIGPKTMNCVEPAGRAESNKSPPSTKEMRNGRAFLEIPTPANPCAPLEARRQQPSEEAHRGGQKGGIWGQGRVGVQGGISSNF